MAIAFFGDYLDPAFRGHDLQAQNRIFDQLGLASDFWRV